MANRRSPSPTVRLGRNGIALGLNMLQTNTDIHNRNMDNSNCTLEAPFSPPIICITTLRLDETILLLVFVWLDQ